jgi:hypothetical protein
MRIGSIFMPVFLSLLFGFSLFCVLVVSLNHHLWRAATSKVPVRPTADKTSGRGSVDLAVQTYSTIRFPYRDIRMPSLPQLSVHRPLERAFPLSYPVLAPPPAWPANTAVEERRFIDAV